MFKNIQIYFQKHKHNRDHVQTLKYQKACQKCFILLPTPHPLLPKPFFPPQVVFILTHTDKKDSDSLVVRSTENIKSFTQSYHSYLNKLNL